MASVQHLFKDAHSFPDQVIDHYAAVEAYERDRHFAAVKIQRTWRGYVVRKELKRLHATATTIQRWIRGWLVRWHLPDYYKAYWDRVCLKYYDKMATRIQALWRGYWARKFLVNPKDLLAQRRLIEEANARIRDLMRKAFEDMERQKALKLEAEAKELVLFILFKLHHLLRTYQSEGVYSINNSKQLSTIEQLLKALHYKEYMDELRKLYQQGVEENSKPQPSLYKDKKLQQMEELLKLRDKSKDVRESKIRMDGFFNQPFNLSKKLPQKPYERSLLCVGEYSLPIRMVTRTTDKSKHISDSDFDLNGLQKIKYSTNELPYYLDFWNQLCGIHNVPNLF